jgi:uncharacterized Zn finger protein
MAKKRGRSDPFANLTWDDLEESAGTRVVSRGRDYQRQGHVSELARTDDGGLIAWVQGTHQYATKVVMGEEGMPEFVCTCPYGANCKHGVAVVLEYLAQVEKSRRIPTADKHDERLALLESEDWDEAPYDFGPRPRTSVKGNVKPFLQDLSKDQLVELVLELAEQHPDIAEDLADRGQIASGSVNKLVTRLRKEIREVTDQPAWRDYWEDDYEDYGADYSGIRKKLDALARGGHADDVLTLGKELLKRGTRQVEESDDDGEIHDKVASCMSVVAKALDQSSLTPVQKLAWAVDAVLEDQFDICAAFEGYLDRRHPKAAWSALADQLLAQLNALKPSKHGEGFARDRLSDWAIHALDRAGRTKEIIPLCEAEARRTGNYDRLVDWLIEERRYEEAEHWIREGIAATKKEWPDVADPLREKFKEIRTRRKDWPVVAAMEVEEFVRYPSQEAFADCEKAARKTDAWPRVREALLAYLERDQLPWTRKDWPLPATGLDAPAPSSPKSFPMTDVLIDVAIAEKDPERVLYWYDHRPKKGPEWFGIDYDRIAAAIETYAPDRAIAIWKGKAESLIAQTNSRAYQEAARYLRKIGSVMAREKKRDQWARYLQELRQTHARKRRLIEVLDTMTRGKILVRKR